MRAPRLAALARVGDSVAIDGCCLTAIAVEGDVIAFDAMAETLARTHARRALAAGDRVNLEAALRAGDPLGGHVVQGHVDGVGRGRRARAQDGIGERLALRAPPEGLAALPGREGLGRRRRRRLTVSALARRRLRGLADPAHAARSRRSGGWRPGDRVNLEVDLLAKYVERLLSPSRSEHNGRRIDLQ